MADFVHALEYVKVNEGVGYETYPKTDQPTNTGIIAADIAEWKDIPLHEVTAQMVKDLTQEDISAIYREFYWDKIHGDAIADEGIATCVFDTCVLRGLVTGIKYVQRTCNLLVEGRLVVDGVFGSNTLNAVNKCDRTAFIRTFENMEAAGYLAIVAAHPEDKRYLNGWMNRAKRLLTLI